MTRRRAWIIVAIAAVLVVLLLALACVDQAPAGSTATEIAEPTRTAAIAIAGADCDGCLVDCGPCIVDRSCAFAYGLELHER